MDEVDGEAGRSLSDIIEFPSEAVRDWIFLENTIREILSEAGMEVSSSDEVVARFKEKYNRYRALNPSATLSLPPMPREILDDTVSAVAKCLAEIERQAQEMTNHMLVDIVTLEVAIVLRDEGDGGVAG